MKLKPAVYWRLRYLQAEAEKVRAEAQSATNRAFARYETAAREANVPTDVPYTWDDATCALIPPTE